MIAIASDKHTRETYVQNILAAWHDAIPDQVCRGHTTVKIPSDYRRQTYHNTVLSAAERVRYLMTEVLPGDWRLDFRSEAQ